MEAEGIKEEAQIKIFFQGYSREEPQKGNKDSNADDWRNTA